MLRTFAPFFAPLREIRALSSLSRGERVDEADEPAVEALAARVARVLDLKVGDVALRGETQRGLAGEHLDEQVRDDEADRAPVAEAERAARGRREVGGRPLG